MKNQNNTTKEVNDAMLLTDDIKGCANEKHSIKNLEAWCDGDDKLYSIITMRLKGVKLKDIASQFGISSEYVRQIMNDMFDIISEKTEGQALAEEEKYLFVFMEYDISEEMFFELTQSDILWGYFKLKYKDEIKNVLAVAQTKTVMPEKSEDVRKGKKKRRENKEKKKSIFLLLDDPRISDEDKQRLKKYLVKQSQKGVKKNDFFQNTEDFIRVFKRIYSDNPETSKADIPIMTVIEKCEEVLGIPRISSFLSLEARLQRHPNIIFGKGHSIRYREPAEGDKEFVEKMIKIMIEDYFNHEISANILYKRYEKECNEQNVYNGYELHYLIKEYASDPVIKMEKSPHLIIGEFDREKEFLRLIQSGFEQEDSNRKKNRQSVISEYCKKYGLNNMSIRAWLGNQGINMSNVRGITGV